ncbi:MAG: BamA/TamA family outer membrane protein [Bacteroidota bacterium]
MRAFDNIRVYLVGVLLALLLNACNITKQLRSSQQLLYNGSDVKIEGENRKDVTRNLPDYIKQKPNRRFLGTTKVRLRFYIRGSKPNSGRFSKWLRNKYGEPPVILDTAFIESSVNAMQSYLRSMGYYYPEISYKIKTHRQRAEVIYTVKTGEVYRIGSYTINCADKQIYDLVKANENDALIKIGKRFNHEVLLKEEKRVVDLMRNNGYFTFSDEFVSFDIDTTGHNWYVHLSLNVMNKSMYETHQKHYVKNVYINIEPNYDIAAFRNKDTIVSENFYYVPNRYKLNPDALERNIFLTPKKQFSQERLNRTYTRLGDLELFRFINILPRTYKVNDTLYVDYTVRLAPSIKYDYILEPQAIASDQSNTTIKSSGYGVAAILQFNNRNVFRNAEIFKLTFRSSFEAQGKVKGKRWFNATEQSLTGSITIPRLLLFPRLDRNVNLVSTKTIFTSSVIYELNTSFDRRVVAAGMIYQLNKKYTSFYITPAEISFTRNLINDGQLQDQIDNDIYLYSMFNNNLILGTRFGFTYSNKLKAPGIYHYVIKWDAVELSGNTATLLSSLLDRGKNSAGKYEVFGVQYAQFAKSAIDFRFNTKYDDNNATVYRLFAGAGLPYGNSTQSLPFERRFWVGGANSLRAWLPRSLGPGSYNKAGQIDFSGDVKLEANAEFRFNMYHKWLEGAVFADAGNVWLMRADSSRTNGEFRLNRFYKEFGLGVGYGLRLNFDIILIRFDLAVPLHDPSYSEGNRWVISEFNSRWLFSNLNLNFGIGYPF